MYSNSALYQVIFKMRWLCHYAEKRGIFFIAFPLISYLYLHLLCHTSVIIIISCHRWRRRKIHPTFTVRYSAFISVLIFFFFIKLGLLEVFELSYSHNGVISYYVIHEHRDVVSSFVQMDARVQLGRNLASLNSPVLLRTCFRLFFQHLYPPPPCYCILMMLF